MLALGAAFVLPPAGAAPQSAAPVRILASEIAESGDVVPVTIDSDLPDIESISFVAPENPTPLALSLHPGPRITLPVTFRVRLAKTQVVHVLVRAGGKDYTATREIGVVVGGCIGT